MVAVPVIIVDKELSGGEKIIAQKLLKVNDSSYYIIEATIKIIENRNSKFVQFMCSDCG